MCGVEVEPWDNYKVSQARQMNPGRIDLVPGLSRGMNDDGGGTGAAMSWHS